MARRDPQGTSHHIGPLPESFRFIHHYSAMHNIMHSVEHSEKHSTIQCNVQQLWLDSTVQCFKVCRVCSEILGGLKVFKLALSA